MKLIALFLALAIVLTFGTAAEGAMSGKGRKLRGYSGSWSGSWGSTTVNGDSGSWNTPYSSGTWGSGGSTSSSSSSGTTTNTNVQTTSTNTNTNSNSPTVTPQAPSPGTVYYNGYGVLVQKLADGQTQTVVNNEYANVNVVSGRRRA